ncbi:hypothetical protein [Brevundimonas sp. FT23028]|uniref:hypothetical protein n=1 Tax=Brevundimonas sp. FT23028 TaxID=3393748 RepID=UPI003B58A121
MGVQQLGYQFNDFGTQVSTGINPIVAFNQQLGQVGFAMSQMQGKAGAVGAFLAGPWGAAITIAAAVLGGLIAKTIEESRALDDGVKKLREEAEETDKARRAKEAFARSAEGVSAAIREMNEELGKSTRSSREAERQALSSAQTNLRTVLGLRNEIATRIELRRQLYLDAIAVQGLAAAGGGDGAEPWTVRAARAGLAQAEADAAKNSADREAAANAVRLASIPIAQRYADEMSSAAGRINRQYDQMRDSAVAAARGNDQLSASLANSLLAIENRRQAELAANSEAQRQAGRTPQRTEAEREYDRLIERSRDYIVQMQHEREEMGLSETQLIRLNTSRRARELIETGTADAVALAGQLVDEAERLIAAINSAEVQVLAPIPRVNLRPLTADQDLIIAKTEALADQLRQIDMLAQDAAYGMASAFGEAGDALGRMLTTMTAYQSRQAEISLDVQQKRMSEAAADRERAAAQVGMYGDMLGAARGFFDESSDGYKVLLTAERAWRVFQLGMSIAAMVQDATETSSSIANSAARGTASAAAGAANMFEQMGAYAFPLVAAMVAVLAGFGLSTGGGSGKSSGSKGAGSGGAAETTDAIRQTNARESQNRESYNASLASTIEVKVTADRDGLNAYVVGTAEEVARPIAAQAGAIAVGAARSAVAADIERRETYGLNKGRG